MVSVAQAHASAGPGHSGTILAVLRRWKLVATVAGALFALAAIRIFTLPKSYESVMELLVKTERQDLVVSPESTATSSSHPSDLSETQINSEIALLKSKDLLRKVVLDTPLSNHEPGAVQAAGELSPVVLQRAVSTLDSTLKIKVVKKSDVIEVSYAARSAALASNVLRDLADRYMDEHLRAHNTPGAFDFFQQQAVTYGRQLKQAESDMTDFRQKFSFLVTPEDKDALVQRSLETQSALEDTDVQIAGYEQKLKAAQRTIGRLDHRVTTQVTKAPEQGLIQDLTQMIMSLKNKRTELAVKFKPDDRLVKEIDQELADTQTALQKASAETTSSETTDLNELRQNTEKDSLQAQVELAGLVARRRKLVELAQVYKGRMFQLAGATVEESARMRQVKELEDDYLLYAKKREEARIGESLDRERITNVAVIQAPTEPALPTSPKIGQDLVLAALLSLCLGLATALVLEFGKRQFGHSDDGLALAS